MRALLQSIARAIRRVLRPLAYPIDSSAPSPHPINHESLLVIGKNLQSLLAQSAMLSTRLRRSETQAIRDIGELQRQTIELAKDLARIAEEVKMRQEDPPSGDHKHKT